MTKRNRWTPPHPEPTPVSIRRELKRHPEGQCHWVQCGLAVWPLNPDLKLCFRHAESASRAILLKISRDRSARETQHEEAVAAFNKDTRTVLDERDAEGWIYFVATDGLIKIGFTARPSQRLRAYSPNATILALYPGTMAKEKYIHGQFTHALAKGREWFHDRPEIRQYAADRVAENGPVPERHLNRFRDARQRTEEVAGKRSSSRKKTAA